MPVSQTIFDAAGGEEAFLRLAHAWHARCLADPVVSHAFPHGYHPLARWSWDGPQEH